MTAATRWSLRALAPLGVTAMALGLGACGSKQQQQQQDPVSMAMQTPGIRMVVIPKQRRDLTVAIPPCSAAQAATSQTSTEIPPGSNQIVVPQGALTESVAVQPCTPSGASSGGSSSGGSSSSGGTSTPPPPPASTILVTPGGASSSQQAQSSSSSSGGGGQQLNQVVLPSNSNVETVIVPPCVPTQGAAPAEQSAGKSDVLRAPTNAKTVAAPACTMQASSSSSSGG
jgi:hypothetical protein